MDHEMVGMEGLDHPGIDGYPRTLIGNWMHGVDLGMIDMGILQLTYPGVILFI